MKAIIMAGGRGTRLGDLTKDLPKPLININGKTIIERVLDTLPASVDKAIISLDYLGDRIIKYLGTQREGLKISYIWQGKIKGTAGAIWPAKDLIKKGERFLVLSGDDIYNKEDIEDCLKHDLTFGLYQEFPPNEKFFSVELDDKNCVKQFVRPALLDKKINVATGVYVLDNRIFGYEPVHLKGNEYGLPQTILLMAQAVSVQAVFMKSWLPINTPKDVQKAEKML